MAGKAQRKSKKAIRSRLAKCKGCGETFTSNRNKGDWTKFCKQECYYEYKKARTWVDRECQRCGKTFRTRRIYVERGQSLFCSVPCRRAAKRYEIDPKLLRRECETCGQIFTISPGEFLSGKRRRHCSKKCSHRRQYMNCEHCGAEFQVVKSAAATRRYCSKNCYRKSKAATRPEQLIAWILEEYGIEFKEQVPVGGKHDRRKECHVDFVLPGLNIALEYDGDYWHDQKRNKRAEKTKTDALRKRGVKLVRLRSTDIKTEPEKSLLKIILRALQDSTPSSQ